MTTTQTALIKAEYREDKEIVEASNVALSLAAQAHALEIVDDETNTEALTMLAACRKAVRRFDSIKKRWTDPLNKTIKLIRSDLDEMASPAKEADKVLAVKTSDWRAKVQEAARKEQERLRKLAEKRQQAAEARAKEKGEEAPPVMPIAPVIEEPAKTAKTAAGTVTFRKQAHMEIVDPAAVPREYCTPDQKKIRAALTSGIVDEIPGVKFWYTEEATVR